MKFLLERFDQNGSEMQNVHVTTRSENDDNALLRMSIFSSVLPALRISGVQGRDDCADVARRCSLGGC